MFGPDFITVTKVSEIHISAGWKQKKNLGLEENRDLANNTFKKRIITDLKKVPNGV